MQIRALEIDVDHDDALARTREGRSEIRRHEGLADAALATADREQSRAARGRSAGIERVAGRMRRRNHVRLPHRERSRCEILE